MKEIIKVYFSMINFHKIVSTQNVLITQTTIDLGKVEFHFLHQRSK